MKKVLLIASAMLVSFLGTAQIICYVEAPSPNEGNYDFTYAEGTSWAVPDMTNPANAVSGIMEFVDDGTSADSLSCNPAVNNLTGKVAVCYRGSCEFGLKALNAQNQGAIAVIIINNAAGAPVAMGGGAEGLNVTIPVIMISNTDGALLRPEILAENTTVFIGSKNGLYGDDLGFTDADLLRAESFSNVQLLCQDNTEFEIEIGTWVRNYGSNDQTGITLNCMIDLGASNVYDETSAPFDLLSGDSVFVSLPTFSQTSYANGYYDMVYTVDMTPLDESTYDNQREADFMINDSLWSYGQVNDVTLQPVNTQNLFNGSTTSLETCLAFQDPNASRLFARGMTFSAGTSQNPTATSIDGEFVEITVYEWTDVFADINDVALDLNNITISDITSAEYIYTANLQGENVYVEFEEYIPLEDNMRYLFCLNLYSPAIYPGYDSDLDYNWNFETYLQPINMVRIDGGQWYPAGYGTDLSPAVTINFQDVNTIGLVELPQNDLTAYPNPANQVVNIPLGQCEGNISVAVVDITGKIVSTQNITMNNAMLTIDVTSLPTGMYTLKLTMEDGSSKDVQIVVNR
ncbi:MAG: T9SS type A sorting domain-containing protein [Crocinitomicaceae bacterium]|nr:T9SS type A sorting domain-containing protein [Crocinitomicaceae bacterium]